MNNYNDALENISKSLQMLGKAIKEVVSSISIYSPQIIKLLEGVRDVSQWYGAIEKLVDNQYVFSDTLTLNFANRVLNSKSIDSLMEEYYTANSSQQLNELIERCREAISPYNNSDLFDQAICAYDKGHYHLACVALFAITDGLFTQVSSNTTHRFKERMTIIHDKIDTNVSLSEMDKRVIVIYLALEKFDKSIYANSDFKGEEPPTVNRNWTLHGRASREYSLIDFIKVSLWVEALLIMDNYEE